MRSIPGGHPPARPTLWGSEAAVSAAHPLAVSAALRILQQGGSAVDATIGAQAVLSVVTPHACGLGGDALYLVAEGGNRVTAVNGAGAAPAELPGGDLTDGGTSATVPGMVGAWGALGERWGQLPLEESLQPAVALAERPLRVGLPLANAVRAQQRRLLRGAGTSWPIAHATTPGEPVVQRPLATTLRTIAREGPSAFYRGELAGAITGASRGAGGTLSREDLRRHETHVSDALSVPFAGGLLHVQPPMSQGVLLAMACRWLEGNALSADPAAREHELVELTGAVFNERDRVCEGAALLDTDLTVERELASRRRGPRSYVHTAGVAVADPRGTVVSSLASVFDDFGSATLVESGGFVLNNRAAGFTGPPNEPAPGKRPVHTLAPALQVTPGGLTALATPGADGQIQTLLQVLVKMRDDGAAPALAIADPRWRSEGDRLLVEESYPYREPLRARGHHIEVMPDGDDRAGAVVCVGVEGGWPFATSDWRRQTWAGIA